MFAILMVILIHTVEGIYGIGEWVPELNSAGFITYSVMRMFGRTAVPIFLMLTGYFLLDRDYSGESAGKYYKTKFIGILTSAELWIFIFWLIQRTLFVDKLWFGGKQPLTVLIRYLAFFDRNDWQISWYIVVLVLLYLFIPFMSNGIKNKSNKIVFIPVIYFLTQEAVFWTINAFFSCFFPNSDNDILLFLRNTLLRFRTDSQGIIGIYFSFVLIGVLLKRGILDKIKFKTLWIILAIMMAVSVEWLRRFYVRDGIQYTIWYEWLPIDILGVILFELFRRSKCLQKRVAFIEWVSKYGLGYFFIHAIVLNILLAYFPVRSQNYFADSVLFLFGTFSISTAIIYLLSKSKWISDKLFLFNRNNK